jgi:hypothetical protein
MHSPRKFVLLYTKPRELFRNNATTATIVCGIASLEETSNYTDDHKRFAADKRIKNAMTVLTAKRAAAEATA